MYIRLNMFSVGSGKRSEVEKLADRFAPIFRAQRGFKGSALHVMLFLENPLRTLLYSMGSKAAMVSEHYVDITTLSRGFRHLDSE